MHASLKQLSMLTRAEKILTSAEHENIFADFYGMSELPKEGKPAVIQGYKTRSPTKSEDTIQKKNVGWEWQFGNAVAILNKKGTDRREMWASLRKT